MSRAVLLEGGEARKIVLTSTTLIGRHWTCHIRLQDARVPLYWVEVRWLQDAWGWRALSAEDRTQGTGRVRDGRWKVLSGAGSSVHLGSTVHIRFTDLEPPNLVLEEPISGRRLENSNALELVEWGDSGVRPLGDEDSPFVGNGASLSLDGSVWRVWLPTDWKTYREPRLNLALDAVHLEVGLSPLRAILTQGMESIEVTGSKARLLFVYALARINDIPDEEGWLSTQDALERWKAVGGPPEAQALRVAWERGKIRTALTRKEAIHAGELFERERRGTAWFVRLALPPDAIALTD